MTSTNTRPMTRCNRCGCYSPADLGHCRWCKPPDAQDVPKPHEFDLDPDQPKWAPEGGYCRCGWAKDARIHQVTQHVPGCPSDLGDLAPHRECPGCGRQQYLALSGWWTHCLADADAGCPPAWRA